MTDKLVLSESKLEQLLALIEKVACKNDKNEHIKLLYQLAPEIKAPHSELATGLQR
jgi:hypothetical protein